MPNASAAHQLLTRPMCETWSNSHNWGLATLCSKGPVLYVVRRVFDGYCFGFDKSGTPYFETPHFFKLAKVLHALFFSKILLAL